ncbi:RES domain-containing protein [Achromobacter insuavis]|uniref:RES domain-containing protein n=1 Tax=Achromobacter insuavis TaxID=1287735 RepID=UPI000E307CEC|nr:RES domain-containing protein [Achromobacter insuavis]
MQFDEQARYEPPSHLQALVPSTAALLAALTHSVERLAAGTVLYRTAGDAKYLLPEVLINASRFGPPMALRHEDGTLPYAWLYLARDLPTAIWEGQFVRHDATRAGNFYIHPSAAETGAIGNLAFGRDLHLWNLSGEACAKLGIHDTISSSDYEACHWIGHRLREAMMSREPDAIPDGFCYPSRRMRGHQAIAIRSDILPDLRTGAVVTHEPFGQSAAYDALRADALCEPAPSATRPMPRQRPRER